MDINTIKADLQMIGSRIIDLKIKNDFVFLDLNSENIRKGIDITHEISESYYLDENLLGRNLILDINLAIKDVVDEEEVELCINLSLEGCFSISSGGTEEELEAMVGVNGVAALYSIARGIISSITSQTCANGTITLPMINAYEMQNQSKIEK